MNPVEHKTPIGKKFWGPPLWMTIHTLAATLRPENAETFETFLWTISDLIPCDYCRVNLKNKLKLYPPGAYLTNNHDAFFYTYFIHDLVNQHVSDKNPMDPKTSPPFDDIKAYYFRSLGEDCIDCKVSPNV